jgi:hypothetical protein
MNIGTYSATESQTFTIADAKYLASRIEAGLTYLRLYCGQLSEQKVKELTLEAAILLKAGILEKVIYGYKKDGDVKYALVYKVNNLGQIEAENEDSTSINPPTGMEGSSWFSFLTRRSNPKLTQSDLERIQQILPIQRSNGEEPSMINGSYGQHNSYSRNGYGMTRSVYTGL